MALRFGLASRLMTALATGLVVLLVASCDGAIDVAYQNTTSHTVILYIGGRQYWGTRRELAPGERFQDAWPTAPGETQIKGAVRVIADDAATGQLIFCRDIPPGEINAHGSTLIITDGPVDPVCAAEAGPTVTPAAR